MHGSVVLFVLTSVIHMAEIRQRGRDDASCLKTRSCDLGVGKEIVFVTRVKQKLRLLPIQVEAGLDLKPGSRIVAEVASS